MVVGLSTTGFASEGATIGACDSTMAGAAVESTMAGIAVAVSFAAGTSTLGFFSSVKGVLHNKGIWFTDDRANEGALREGADHERSKSKPRATAQRGRIAARR